MAVLEEYASSVQLVGEEDIRSLMEAIVGEMRREGKVVGAKDRGAVRKAVLEGALGGRSVEGSVLGKVLQEVLPNDKVE